MQHRSRAKHDERLGQLAREYQARGYEVFVEPGHEQLPDFLASFRPDLLARGQGENVIVEVKSRPALAQSAQLARLAKAVELHPGWRLELVVVEPEESDEGVRPLSREDLEDSVAELQTLLASNHNEAALLLAWSLTEAALRLLARSENVDVRRGDAAYLLKQLATQAVITREDYDFLVHAMWVRNAVAHGFKTKEFDPREVRVLVSTIDRLLHTIPEAA